MTLHTQSISETFKSRRTKDLSTPVLIIALYTMAFLTCFIGLALFVHLTGKKLATEYEQDLRATAQIGSLKVENLFIQIERTSLSLLTILEKATDVNTPAETLRSTRQSILNALENGPIAALFLKDKDGEILVSVSEESDSPILQSPPPLRKTAQLLNDRLHITRNPDGRVIIFQDLDSLNSLEFVLILDEGILSETLIPQNLAQKVAHSGFLVDKDSWIIAKIGNAHTSDDTLEKLNFEGLDTSISPLIETQARTMATSGTKVPFLAVDAGVNAYDLRVVYTSTPISFLHILKAAGIEILSFIGPGILGLLLIISLIQNEWQKGDRRRNTSSNAVARAEIASDLLDAGIIDWNVRTSSVIYSQGWHKLFEYDVKFRKEEIYDWISRVHDEDRPRVRDSYQQLLEGEISQLSHMVRVRTSSGNFVSIKENCVARQNKEGKPEHIILVQMQQ